MGTVIDPEMRDEIRVTVVVTGLDNPDYENKDEEKTARSRFARGRRGKSTSNNVTEENTTSGKHRRSTAVDYMHDETYIDIPTFLRKQAD